MKVQTSHRRDYLMLFAVALMSIGANLPAEFSSSVHRKFLFATLVLLVAIALIRYAKFAFVLAVAVLAIGANLPKNVAHELGISPIIMIIALVSIVVISFANRVLKLPLGLDKKQGFSEEYSATSLFNAIVNARADAVQSLLKAGVNVNACTAKGLTPLMMASSKGYAEIVQMLVTHGANVRAKDSQGTTALAWAERFGHERTIEILKEAVDQA